LVFFKKHLRQFKLTKIVSKSSKHKLSWILQNTKLALYQIILDSKFAITINDSLNLIKNKLVYVNGLLVKNPFYYIYIGDFIQLKISPKYYYFYKNNFNNNLKYTFLVSYRLWRFNRFKGNFYKQSPINLPNWLKKLQFLYNDIPNYLEVDFVILCTSIIQNNKLSNFNPYVNFFMFRLYNWKYLN
jgi:ribosomal protein S4